MRSALAVLIVLLLCFASSVYQLWLVGPLRLADQCDFSVYYCAARLVHVHHDREIYDTSSGGADPQLRTAPPDSAMAKAAKESGLQGVMLYVYTPLLADLVLPLQYLSVRSAEMAWRILSILLAAGAAVLLAPICGEKLFGRGTLLILMAMFCFRPLWFGLYVGQVSIVVFVLWITSLLLYKRGKMRWSGVILGVAIVLKLTPVILVIPMLFWKEWRWLRWCAISVSSLCVGMILFNGAGVLRIFQHDVLGPMSDGVAAGPNATVASALRLLIAHEGWHMPSTQVSILSKVIAVAVLAFAAWHSRSCSTTPARIVALSIFALLSTCLAPVAWPHAYIIGVPMLLLLWKQVLSRDVTFSILIAACVLTLAVDLAGVARLLENLSVARSLVFGLLLTWVIWHLRPVFADACQAT